MAQARSYERDAGFVSGDHGEYHMGDVTSGEVVSLELVGGERESRFDRGNAAVNDQRRGNLTEAHEDEVEQADGSTGCARLKPDTEEFDQDSEENKAEQ